jgi:hypothetical protein
MASKSAIDSAIDVEAWSLPTQDPTVEQPGFEYVWWHNALKRLLLRIGSGISVAKAQNISKAAGVLEVASWLGSECSLRNVKSFRKCERVWDYVGNQVADQHVAYLEFGVWKGYSMKHWANLLKNPQTVMHGFDSFEGLPEKWTEVYRKGSFNEGGKLPEIVDDPRVTFFKGWFEETLPTYQIPPHEVLVVNIDCDLYNSTKYVLDVLRTRDAIHIGDWIYLDEFRDRDHEFRAFKEFVEVTGMRFEVVAEANFMWNVAFRRIG